MTRNIWIISILSLLLITGGWWYFNKSSAFIAPSGLVKDIHDITPQFIDEHSSLSPKLLKEIERDIIDILIAQEPNNKEYYSQNGITLSAIGKRYVSFSVLRPTDNPAPIQILDSLTQKSDKYISGQLLFKTNKVAVYVDGQNITTYKPDESMATEMPGAKLSGNETYDHCGGCMAGNQDLQYSHTDTAFTINTYDWVAGTVNPTSHAITPKNVRSLTFILP